MWGEFNGNQYGGLPWAELWIKTLWWTTLKPSSADRSNWSTFKGGPKYSGRTVPKWSFHLVSNRNLGFWAEWEEPEPVRSEVHYINAQSFLYLNFHLLAIFSLCSLLASNFSLSSSLHSSPKFPSFQFWPGGSHCIWPLPSLLPSIFDVLMQTFTKRWSPGESLFAGLIAGIAFQWYL